jgi:hypothetical protein
MIDVWQEPIELRAGDTLSFSKCLSNFKPSGGWSLQYQIRGSGDPISFQSTDYGDHHVILVPSATTAAWKPGDCKLIGFATDNTQRFQIYDGQISILPNATSDAEDTYPKTFAQKMLEQIETALLAQAGNPLAASRVGDSQFQYLTPDQLTKQYAIWLSKRRNEIAKERAAAGLPSGYKTHATFSVTPSIGWGTGVRQIPL